MTLIKLSLKLTFRPLFGWALFLSNKMPAFHQAFQRLSAGQRLGFTGDLPTEASQGTLTDYAAKAGAGRLWVGGKQRGEVERSSTAATCLSFGSVALSARWSCAVALV